MKDKKIQGKNKKKRNLKEQGITLIALVVTIILLLILAGVTISQIVGGNGLFQRARQAVEKYKNAAEEEQIQIGMLEQYVSDFSVVVGGEGEDKASVEIKTFTVEGNPKEQTIKVNLTIEGEASKIQLSIDNGKTWVPNEEEKLEETEGAYTYTFENLDLGKSYYVRVKVYDEEGKYVEAISDIVTLSNSITAVESDVLKDKTYLAEDGSIKTGTMPNIGAISGELSAGGEQTIQAGYTSGGKITAKDLASQTAGNATEEQILSGQKAWVNGEQVTGIMENRGTVNKTLNSGESYTILKGYYEGGTINAEGYSLNTVGTFSAKDSGYTGTSGHPMKWLTLSGTTTQNEYFSYSGKIITFKKDCLVRFYDGKLTATSSNTRCVLGYLLNNTSTTANNASQNLLSSTGSTASDVAVKGIVVRARRNISNGLESYAFDKWRKWYRTYWNG